MAIRYGDLSAIIGDHRPLVREAFEERRPVCPCRHEPARRPRLHGDWPPLPGEGVDPLVPVLVRQVDPGPRRNAPTTGAKEHVRLIRVRRFELVRQGCRTPWVRRGRFEQGERFKDLRVEIGNLDGFEAYRGPVDFRDASGAVALPHAGELVDLGITHAGK